MIKGVSCCCFFKDEEENLSKSLPSWLPFCDELVLVDTGSTDRSRAVVEEMFRHVLRWPDISGGADPCRDVLPTGHRVAAALSPWRDDFSHHYNETFALATGRWIFQVDADEVVEGIPEELAAFLGMAGQVWPVAPPLALSFWYPDTPPGGAWHHPRIFRRSDGWRYEFKIHSELVAPVGGSGEMVNVPPETCRVLTRSPVRETSLDRTIRFCRRELERDDLTDRERAHYQSHLDSALKGY